MNLLTPVYPDMPLWFFIICSACVTALVILTPPMLWYYFNRDKWVFVLHRVDKRTGFMMVNITTDPVLSKMEKMLGRELTFDEIEDLMIQNIERRLGGKRASNKSSK